MKTLVSSLCILVIAGVSFASAADSVALKDIEGDYYFGNGLGVNCSFTVTTRGTFTFEWTGCQGTYDWNKGSASVKDGILHITPQRPNLQGDLRGTPTEFCTVRWGVRMYLIPTNAIVKFCSDVNLGTEPRRWDYGYYYMRRGDSDKPVAGRPAVPDQWTKFLLDRPVRGKVTELISKQEAWLDKGSADGLLEGMILTAKQHAWSDSGHFVIAPEHMRWPLVNNLGFAQVHIEAVETNRCRIKCLFQDNELAVGQTVSSRLYE